MEANAAGRGAQAADAAKLEALFDPAGEHHGADRGAVGVLEHTRPDQQGAVVGCPEGQVVRGARAG